MKIKIKVKVLNKYCYPKVSDNGEWVDLKSAIHYDAEPKDSPLYHVIPLGIAIKMPKGFEALIVPRSSTYKNFKVLCANSSGVIDNSYCGNRDQLGFPALSIEGGEISKGDRICQLRVQLSQKANVWQKLKWLLSSGIKLQFVEDLGDCNRGGFGTSGIK